ncbi:MAG: SMP-30/gluconolactonase/LRE family protein [Planctomycetota bacterium]
MTKRKKVILRVSLLLLTFLLYLLFWPVPVDPEAWTPPVALPYEGDYALNSKLEAIERIPVSGEGPETIILDNQQQIYAGLNDGRILRIKSDQSTEVFTNTGGRPLGLCWDMEGNLIVADAIKGLLSVSKEGKIKVLTSSADGVAFAFTDDVDIAKDGNIYFTDASTRFSFHNYKMDLIENRPNGRLLLYDPKTQQTQVLLKNLYFANGIALSPDQTFLLVNETSRYRVRRYWLTGEKKGTTDIFLDNLPGFPDGISSNGNDLFWIAVGAPRDPVLDTISPYPFLKKVVTRLPEFVQPKPQRHIMALGVNAEGKVIHNLQDPQGKNIAFMSSVEQIGEMLYFGSFQDTALGRMKFP